MERVALVRDGAMGRARADRRGTISTAAHQRAGGVLAGRARGVAAHRARAAGAGRLHVRRAAAGDVLGGCHVNGGPPASRRSAATSWSAPLREIERREPPCNGTFAASFHRCSHRLLGLQHVRGEAASGRRRGRDRGRRIGPSSLRTSEPGTGRERVKQRHRSCSPRRPTGRGDQVIARSLPARSRDLPAAGVESNGRRTQTASRGATAPVVWGEPA
jgi:hypothetical protein